jgi:hypothetical protein
MHASSMSTASSRVCAGAVPEGGGCSFSNVSGTVIDVNSALAVSAPRSALRKCSLCWVSVRNVRAVGERGATSTLRE